MSTAMNGVEGRAHHGSRSSIHLFLANVNLTHANVAGEDSPY